MRTCCFPTIVAISLALNILIGGIAYAGFGFGDDSGKSGLDFTKGYDVNTVSNVTGRVVSPPKSGERGHVFAQIHARGEAITLCLGPESFWQKNGFPLRSQDQVTVKGSLAQGKDGIVYLMVQRIVNRTTGSQSSLRDEKGNPTWSGRNEGGMMWDRGNSMMGGGMMRGGMMRR